MTKRTRPWGLVVAALLLLTGCSGDDSPDGDGEQTSGTDTPVVGSFVGKVDGTEAFVAVVAAPATDGKDSGTVQIYFSDGVGTSEFLSGTISDNNSFQARSDDGAVETDGELTADLATGTVVLPGGTETRYEASSPSGAAGFYELTVSSGGELSGASTAGLSATGRVTLERRGSGVLRLVDGQRLELAVSRMRTGLADLRPKQVRLIILSNGEVRGVAMGRTMKGDPSGYSIRSA